MRFDSPCQRNTFAILSGLTLFLANLGCESAPPPARAAVSGTVFANGTALSAGTLRFVPLDKTNGAVITAAISDGAFALAAEQGPFIGKHRVEVVPADMFDFDPGDQEAAELAMKQGKIKRTIIPPRYQRSTSPLRADIPPEGISNLEFNL